MLSGSPRKRGCTYTALTEVAEELNKTGIETEILHVGGDDVRGCMGYGVCVKLDRCICNNDKVNEAVERLKGFSDLMVGSPVHYASVGDAITPLLDRFFHSDSAYAVYRPGTAVTSARRIDTMVTLDQLNRYFMISQMPMASSQYWNMVHGNCPEDAKRDEEGVQIMRVLGCSMVRLLQSIEAGEEAGISCPQPEIGKEKTNFMR